MSTSTAPGPSDTARRRRPAIYLIVGGLGLAAALVLDTRVDAVAPGAWSGADFGRALAQYRRFAWFDSLETALSDRQGSARRSALVDRFPDPVSVVDVPTGLHIEVAVADTDLNGAGGLVSNIQKKGDAWERPAAVAIYRDGRAVVETRAGLRVHGGTVRRQDNIDFRLYFRAAYDAMPPRGDQIWENGQDRLDRMVMKGGITAGVANLVALETVRRLGGLAPQAEIGTSRLNGGPVKSGLILEHLSADWLDARFGHRDFVFRRLKGGARRGRGTLYTAFEQTVDRMPSVTLADVEPAIEIDELIAQYLAIALTRCSDPFQGAILLDQSAPGAKWRFVAWDMEGAFPAEAPPDYVRYLGYAPRHPPILRAVLWRKLAADPMFRGRVLRAAEKASEVLVTDSWIDGLAARLQDRIAALPPDAGSIARREVQRTTGMLKTYRDSLVDDLRRTWTKSGHED